jgi:hypothetical protein
LELEVERLVSNLRDKKEGVKRASNTRQEYKQDIQAVKDWLISAEERLQQRSQEPHLLKESLQVNENEDSFVFCV